MEHNKIQSDYWDNVAKNLSVESTSTPAKIELAKFFDFIQINKADKILDVGCGVGRITLPLLKIGKKVVGTELSDKSLKELRLMAEKMGLSTNLKLIATDFYRPYFESEFDLAICCNVIHHFDPQHKSEIIKNIVRALKPGGILAIIEPNPFNFFYYPWYCVKEISGQDRGRWNIEKGFLQSTKKRLKQEFLNNNFKNIQIKGYALFPSRLGIIFPPILKLNSLLLKMPLIKEMALFWWITGQK